LQWNPVQVSPLNGRSYRLTSPGQQGRPAGILLLDCGANRLYLEILATVLADQARDFAELWAAITEDLNEKATAMGGRELLHWLEESASHFVRISEPEMITVSDFHKELRSLDETHVAGEFRSFAVSKSSGR